MKDLVWDKTLSVQVDEVDDDHRKLVNLFNLLNHSVAEGEPEAYVTAVMDELIACTVWHFRHEERLMVKYGYEGLAAHRAEHDDLVASVTELQGKLSQEGASVTSAEIEYLERWLTGHILGTDMDLGAFLCEAM